MLSEVQQIKSNKTGTLRRTVYVQGRKTDDGLYPVNNFQRKFTLC